MKSMGHRSHVSGWARFVRTWRRKVDEAELRTLTAPHNPATVVEIPDAKAKSPTPERLGLG